jgi:hypothetical protein
MAKLLGTRMQAVGRKDRREVDGEPAVASRKNRH